MTKIDEIADPLLELNLAVAAIAGWENIQEWNPNPKTEKPKKVFQGTNKKHPELGIFVPDYTRDLNAIIAVFTDCMGTLGCHFQLDFAPSEYYSPPSKPFLAAGFGHHVYDESPAIALCKLLLGIAPTLSGELETVYTVDTLGNPVAHSKFKPELDHGDFVTIAGLEIEIAREILKPTEKAAKALKDLGLTAGLEIANPLENYSDQVLIDYLKSKSYKVL